PEMMTATFAAMPSVVPSAFGSEAESHDMSWPGPAMNPSIEAVKPHATFPITPPLAAAPFAGDCRMQSVNHRCDIRSIVSVTEQARRQRNVLRHFVVLLGRARGQAPARPSGHRRRSRK